MKTGLALIPIFCLFLAGIKVSTSTGQPLNKGSNYVVIGAFSIPKNAIEFTENAKKDKYEAEFSINPARKLFYVYVLETSSREEAFEKAKKIRKDTPYFDTWVFTGVLGDETSHGADINPITGKGIKTIEASDEQEATYRAAQSKQGNTIIASTSQQPMTLAEQKSTSASTVEEATDGNKKFFFKIFTSDKELGGDVDVLDIDKTKPRKAASYRGNEVVSVKPVNRSGNIALVCEVFGYRKVEQALNFNEPQLTEGVKLEDHKITVPFQLVRLKKGDVAIMYNVYFFKDAGVMRPESHYEVTSLLEMLKENPNYKIRIHGHTNGNGAGKIISMGDSKSFFSLKDTKEGFGSAKKLSEERAKVIQRYLESQGIDPARMQIKAWGGKRPVYAKDSQQAHANVRVEIEILED